MTRRKLKIKVNQNLDHEIEKRCEWITYLVFQMLTLTEIEQI